MGNFKEAEKLYNEAWQIKKDTLKEFHADTIVMYGQLDRLYHDFGDLQQAELFLEENHRLRLEILSQEDPEHPQIAVAKNPLAFLYLDLGKYEEALTLAQEGLELRRKRLGSLHPYTAFSLDTKSLTLLALDRIEEAEECAKDPAITTAITNTTNTTPQQSTSSTITTPNTPSVSSFHLFSHFSEQRLLI